MYKKNNEHFTNYNDIKDKCAWFPYIDKLVLRCCDDKNNCYFINNFVKTNNERPI